MKTKYKYIHFVEVTVSGKTKEWDCRANSNNDWLAGVAWYPQWKKYCVMASNEYAVFSADCLRDMADLLEKVNKEHREGE